METVAVLDFETTGLSPNLGDRATEIAIVLMRGDEVVDRFESLMNAGRRIPEFVSALTGISNEMIAAAPPAATVMAQAERFLGDYPVVAHNASFDRRFWEAELARIARRPRGAFACTMLIARRVYPQLRNHKLQSLAAELGLPRERRAHRAMADAVLTGLLWSRMRQDISQGYGVSAPDHRTLAELQVLTASKVPAFLRRRCAS